MYFLGISSLDYLLRFAGKPPTVDNIAEKYKVSSDYIYSIVKYDPSFDSHRGIIKPLGMWLLKNVNKGYLSNDDRSLRNAVVNVLFLNKQIDKKGVFAEKAKDDFELVDWVEKHFKGCSARQISIAFDSIADLNKESYLRMAPEEIFNIVRKFKPENVSLDKYYKYNEDAADDVNVLYNKDGWLILFPLTSDAAVYFGSATKWCTSNMSNCGKYYEEYMSKGPLYIIIDNNSGHRFQLHYTTGSFMNELDRPGAILWKSLDVPDEVNNFLYNLTGLGIFNKDSSLLESEKQLYKYIILSNTYPNVYADILKEEYIEGLKNGYLTMDEYSYIMSHLSQDESVM